MNIKLTCYMSLERTLVLLLALISWACSQSGQNNNNAKNSAPVVIDKPFDEDAIKKTHVRAFSFLANSLEDTQCSDSSSRKISALKAIVLDGLESEWTDIDVVSADLGMSESLTQLKVARLENGLAMFLSKTETWQEFKIDFYSLTKNRSNTFFEEGFSIIIDGQKIVQKKGAQSVDITNSNLIAWSSGADGIELFLSDYILDGIQFYPYWTIAFGFKADSGPDQLPALNFSSKYQGNQEFQASRCYYQSDSSTSYISWINGSRVDDQTMKIIENISIILSQSLKMIVPNQSEITLISGAMDKEAKERMIRAGIVPIDTQLWKNPENSLFETSIAIQQLIHDQYSIMLRNYDGNSERYVPLLSIAISHAILRQKLGIYSFLQAVKKNIGDYQTHSYEDFGLFLGLKVKLPQFIEAISQCLDAEDSISACTLRKILNVDDIEPLLEKWVSGETNIPGYEYRRLMDQDGDGLPGLIEEEFLTSDGYDDTDFDGWSDLSEIALGFDPRVSVNHPDGLVLDGNIGDWFNLIPGQVLIDQDDGSKTCQKTDLAFYGAFIANEKILIAAKLANENYSDLVWEVSIEKEGADTKIYKINNNSKFFGLENRYRVDVPFSYQKGVLEIMEPYIGDGANINVQIRVYEGSKFCDDTPWFHPSKSEL